MSMGITLKKGVRRNTCALMEISSQDAPTMRLKVCAGQVVLCHSSVKAADALSRTVTIRSHGLGILRRGKANGSSTQTRIFARVVEVPSGSRERKTRHQHFVSAGVKPHNAAAMRVRPLAAEAARPQLHL